MAGDQGAPTDASSVIYIAKCDAFGQIARCIQLLVLPPAVWREAVEAGEAIGAPEVIRIRKASEAGLLQRRELNREEGRLAHTLAESEHLGAGESQVLAMARAVGRCVVDEGRASRVAKALGVTPIPTLLLPVLGYPSGRIEGGEALELVKRLAVVTGVRAEVVFAIEQALLGGI